MVYRRVPLRGGLGDRRVDSGEESFLVVAVTAVAVVFAVLAVAFFPTSFEAGACFPPSWTFVCFCVREFDVVEGERKEKQD